jgi:hypothetical protein
MDSLDDKIVAKIKKARRGSLFFTEDFLSFGSAKSVAKTLERLTAKGDISHVARGIYARLEIDPIIGELKPSTEAIAEAIRKRDKARIMPTGALALNALNLSTQVPMNVVYQRFSHSGFKRNRKSECNRKRDSNHTKAIRERRPLSIRARYSFSS